MIKIEIYKGKNGLIEAKTLNQKNIKIGREPHSDFFLPDSRVSRQEISFERQPDGTYVFRQKDFQRHFNDYFEIEFFDYKIKAYAIYPISDEITQDLTNHPSSDKAIFYSILLWGSIFVSLSFFDLFIYENWSIDNFKIGRELLSSTVTVVVFTLILSLISRAVDGTYHFKRILSLSLKASVFAGLISSNLLGLRWLFGQWLWYEQIYSLVLIFCLCYYAWQLGSVIFNHVAARNRAIFLFLLMATILGTQSLKYIPYRETYQYLTLRSPPPLLPLFEKSPIDRAEFLSKVKSL